MSRDCFTPRETSIFRLGYSRLDSGDVLTDANGVATADALRELVFKDRDPAEIDERNRLADVDHLIAHRRSGNDAFVTRDGEILQSAKELLVEFQIKVMSPNDAVECLKRLLGKSNP